MAYVIPKKLQVGFQDREDTYTGKLSFSTYDNEKTGRYIHSPGWENWCDKDGRITIDNIPKTGFIFNRQKAHVSSSYYFNSRRIVFRVFHPDGFEFEIKPDNVNLLLEYTDISKKEIMEPCIIAFSGKTIILLPCSHPEYQNILKKQQRKEERLLKDKAKTQKAYQIKGSNDVFLYAGKYGFSFFGDEKIDVFYNLNSQKYEAHDFKKFTVLKNFTLLEEHKKKIDLPNNFFNFDVKEVHSKTFDVKEMKNRYFYLNSLLNINIQDLSEYAEEIESKGLFFANRTYLHSFYPVKINSKNKIVRDETLLPFTPIHQKFRFIENLSRNDFQYHAGELCTIDLELFNGKSVSYKEYLDLYTNFKCNKSDFDLNDFLTVI